MDAGKGFGGILVAKELEPQNQWDRNDSAATY
jgi:hypothetical protein